MQTQNWYCAKTSGRETQAEFYLRRAGLEAFRPVIHRYFKDRRTLQQRFRVLSLFPGYVFVRIETDAERDRASRAIGVAYILGEWHGTLFKPRQMPACWIGELIWAGPIIEGKSIAFKPGDMVLRAVGALADLIGEIQAIDKSRIAKVKVAMFGKEHVVRVPVSELEPVADNGHGHREVLDSASLAQSAKLCQNSELIEAANA